MKWLILLLLVILIAAHQDIWWWDDIRPLVFGVLPIGLAWHCLLTLLAALTGWLAIRYCWPADLREPPAEHPGRDGDA